MAAEFTIRVNNSEVKARLPRLAQPALHKDALNIIGAYMVGSVAKTFRDEGVPAGSWPRLAPSTLKRKTPGQKILIGKSRGPVSAHLWKSVTYEVKENEGKVYIGSNLKYARVHQLGGVAGRRPPFKKKGGRRPVIPARPYLVFRPEDPGNIQLLIDRLYQNTIDEAGL